MKSNHVRLRPRMIDLRKTIGRNLDELVCEVDMDSEQTLSSAPVGAVVSQLQPTFISLDQEVLRKAVEVCETAIENTAELLVNHDSALGRTTRKNKWIAERYETEIAAAKECRNLLRASMGWPPIG